MLTWPVASRPWEFAVPVLSLMLALSSAPAQYIGGYPNPRLPLGRAAALGAFRPNAPYVIREPGVGPMQPPPPIVIERTIVYVVVPQIIVRPSEVIFEPPEVRFVTPETTQTPSDPATDTGPR